MPGGDDQYQKYYGALQQAYGNSGSVEPGAFTAGFDDFKTKMADQGYAQKIHDALSNAYGENGVAEKGAFTLPFNDFYWKLNASNMKQAPTQPTTFYAGDKQRMDEYEANLKKTHDQNVQQATTDMPALLNTKETNKAIDHLNQNAFQWHQDYQSFLKNQNNETQPGVPKPKAVRFPDQVASDRDAVKSIIYDPNNPKSDPVARRVLTEAKRLNPDSDFSKKVNAATYVLDAKDRNPAIVSANYDKLKTGELDYDLSSKRLVTKEGTIRSFFRGLDEHQQKLSRFQDIMNMPDDELITDLENKKDSYNPDIPIAKPEGRFGEVARMLGNNANSMLEATAASMTAPVNPQAAGWAATLILSNDAGQSAYADTFENTYYDLRRHGVDPHKALDAAKEQARFSGAINAAQMAGLGYSGVKMGMGSGEKFSSNAIKVFNDIARKSPEFLAQLPAEMGVNGGLAAGVQALENVHQGKDFWNNTVEQGVGNGIFAGAIATLMHSPGQLSERARETTMNTAASMNKDYVDDVIAQNVHAGNATPEQANKFSADMQHQRDLNQGIPNAGDVPNAAKEDILKYKQQREDVKNKIDSENPYAVDEAFEKEYKEKINQTKSETGEGKDGINEKIRQKAAERNPKEEFSTFSKTGNITAEAEELLNNLGESGRPTSVTKRLEKIAKDNGIEVTDKTLPDEIVEQLREKRKQQPQPEHQLNFPETEMPKHTVSFAGVTNIKPKENASNLRENQGRIQEEGGTPENGQEVRSHDVQQNPENPSGTRPAVEQKRTIEELEKERDERIKKEGKPNLKMEFAPAKELAKAKDPLAAKSIHDKIKDRFKELKKITNCLWA